MQTVPSLIGTGTAVAAAASGLVFGQPTEPASPSTEPRSQQRPFSVALDQPLYNRLSSLPHSRPGTGSAAASIGAEDSTFHTLPRPPSNTSRPPLSRYQRPQSSQITPPKVTSRRQSFVRQTDHPPSAITEPSRDSISSNGSWMRRLSIRPLSQHGSPRSSVGPNSPSITFSHGSGAPILSPLSTTAPSLPPNKLVKRTSSIQVYDPALTPRRNRSHLPTLRRPATSHQRSATLHHFSPDLDLTSPVSPIRYSFEQQDPHRDGLTPPPLERTHDAGRKPKWTSFFHSRTANLAGRAAPTRLSELSPNARSATPKRVCLGTERPRQIHLVKPHMVSAASVPPTQLPQSDTDGGGDDEGEQSELPAEETDVSGSSLKDTTPKRARRSISMTFSSAGNWVSSRTSGSIRRPKRGGETKGGNKRHVSDPAGGPRYVAEQGANPTGNSSTPPTPSAIRQGSALDSAAMNASGQPLNRRRNASSPIPPLSRNSTFHVDLSRLGSSGGASSSHPTRPNQPSGSSASSAALSQLRAPQNERSSSIMDGSEADTREFTSGDDDDTDFKSDTMFDSIRTGASGRVRTVETPLDSMYDESPPSTAGNGKTKRLSIQEILGKAWDEDTKITEEDESVSTPVRTTHFSQTATVYGRSGHGEARPALDPSPFPMSDFGRFSIDDDFDDEDWARDDDDDDDALYNSLSPPSKESSLNSRGMNPNVRLALASISGNGLLEASHSDTNNERPLSTLFDWSEPSVHDRQDADGHSPRPRTAYAKQELDSRGGRSVIRKGPTPTHVRSQSVPVVHEVSEDAKVTGSKYGTWGLGTKTVSEDWDEDFEFGGASIGNEEKGNENPFAVPESIRATQPSVKAHSGQIRELSLLVNDLKRLCRHGRDMDMLNGQQRALWKEAEGIIALASPDEDDSLEDHVSSSSVDFDAFEIDDHYLDDGLDGNSLEKPRPETSNQAAAAFAPGLNRDRLSPRRRSVFSPDDDIFGGNAPPGEDSTPLANPSRPRTPDGRPGKPDDVTGVVKSMMDAMQYRSVPNPSRTGNRHNRMHFDTNSLKALVKRAGDLRDLLSDMIRRADQITQSPARTPRHERHPESSPAFTRVFDDPGSSPPRRAVKSRGNSGIESASPESSPSTAMNRRMQQMMTVS